MVVLWRRWLIEGAFLQQPSQQRDRRACSPPAHPGIPSIRCSLQSRPRTLRAAPTTTGADSFLNRSGRAPSGGVQQGQQAGSDDGGAADWCAITACACRRPAPAAAAGRRSPALLPGAAAAGPASTDFTNVAVQDMMKLYYCEQEGMCMACWHGLGCPAPAAAAAALIACLLPSCRSAAVPAPGDVQVAGVWQRCACIAVAAGTWPYLRAARPAHAARLCMPAHRRRRRQAPQERRVLLPAPRVLLHPGRRHLCAVPVVQGTGRWVGVRSRVGVGGVGWPCARGSRVQEERGDWCRRGADAQGARQHQGSSMRLPASAPHGSLPTLPGLGQDVGEMAAALKDRCPSKIDIGPVYNVDPARRAAYAGAWGGLGWRGRGGALPAWQRKRAAESLGGRLSVGRPNRGTCAACPTAQAAARASLPWSASWCLTLI